MLAVKKILVFLLVFAALIVIRGAFMFITSLKKSENNEPIPKKEQILFAVAVSYIITIATTGFKLWS